MIIDMDQRDIIIDMDQRDIIIDMDQHDIGRESNVWH